MFKYGIGVRRDARFAFACYSVAARTYEGAKYNLAAALIEGDGVPKDVRKGLRLMRAGERAGDVDSMNYLGFCYRVGEGVEKDPRKGFALSLKAAKAGLAAAQYDIGMCLLSGTGVEKNSSAAERWISRAARRGDSDAQEYLARRRGRRKPKAGPKTIRSVDKRS
jgi:uncharacterized protein